MRYILFSSFISLVTFCFCLGCSNNQEPYVADFKTIRGYVIGKETCNTDESQDFWLIDFTYLPNPAPMVGDSLIYNGIAYKNVLKTRGLIQEFKKIGLPVSIDYKIISTNKTITTGCTVTTPSVYPLKELAVLYQFEIR